EDRVRQFKTSLHPSISNSLLCRSFASAKELLDGARLVEDLKKDIDHHFPRPIKNKLNSDQSTDKRSSGYNAHNNPEATKKAASGNRKHPNDKFGPVAKRPEGWVGIWYEPGKSARKLTDEEMTQFQKEGRCWKCRGSGHPSN